MAKWKSVSINEEIKNPDGSIKTQGVTVWIPENDAAKADDKRVQKAIEYGKYTPKDPNEAKNMQEKLKAKQHDALKRAGLLPRQ